MTLKIFSDTFTHNTLIPSRFTCDGLDISPPLHWTDPPPPTQSFAIIVDDPDAPDPAAPKMTWVHWILYNIPTTVRRLPEGVRPKDLPSGTRQGANSWNKTGYGGPCPPVGTHRYFHKLYCLDTMLPDLQNPTKERLMHAMGKHIIAQAEIIGTYLRH